jgi:hypothetical protein
MFQKSTESNENKPSNQLEIRKKKEITIPLALKH